MGQNAAALPKYIQISETLIRDIAAGRLADGARLPPERDMARDLQISVGTLRKALAEMEKMGLLERVQGSGNYIRGRASVPSVYSMLRLELASGGGLPTAHLLSVDLLAKPGGTPAFGPAPNGWRFRRLRFLNQTPAAVEEIWLDGTVTDQIDPGDVSESLYLFYREKLGLAILSAQDHLRIGPVPDWAPRGFPLRPGDTAGYIERISRDTAGDPVEFSRTWFDPATVHYVNRIGKT